MRTVALIILLFVCTSMAIGGELVLKGKYNGKNIFVRNPFNNDTREFCTTKVFVNDRLVFDNPQLSAYQVELSHLELGDLVVLRIEYRSDCEPVVLNPAAISFTTGFQFITSQSDGNSIVWSTKGELPGGKFEVEQLTEKKGWQLLNTVAGKGEQHNNQYSIAPNHFPGDNHYRIKHIDTKGEEYYSVEFIYTSTNDPITFSPQQVTTTITLSRAADYAILDMNENEIQQGKGKEIYLQELKPGQYFLLIENRKERFIKQ